MAVFRAILEIVNDYIEPYLLCYLEVLTKYCKFIGEPVQNFIGRHTLKYMLQNIPKMKQN